MKRYAVGFAPVAKALLLLVSILLIIYGIYDYTTLSLLLGSMSALAVAFWQFYDEFIEPKKNEDDTKE